jgi:L-lactate dehydrogenase complex protein LldG
MPEIENPGRERILERIQSALQEKAPRHDFPASGMIFPDVQEPFERFVSECAQNNTECIVTPDLQGSSEAVAKILAELPEGEIFAEEAPLLRAMFHPRAENRSLRWSNEGGPRESSQATITRAEALVARTGSIVVSAQCGGRGASAVAPVHIVIATQDQIVAGLDEAFAILRQRDAVARNSFLCVITGSSRTADIEKILVMGAHGPRRLVVVLALKSE